MRVNVIGAGLAGCEAAWVLANNNIEVNLYEVKKIKKNSVQNLDGFAELVCSNSLRSNDILNAVGVLKLEMKKLNSLIIDAAENSNVPAGNSLAVDRDNFSKYITEKIYSNKKIKVIDEEFFEIDLNQPTIICTGPLTTEKLQKNISKIIGKDYFHFFDAVAPILRKDSLNMNIIFQKNRYEKGNTNDYLNCPMNQKEFDIFYNELIKAESNEYHLEEEKNLIFFEGCMPIEAMAKRSKKSLLFGPMKPIGLRNLDGTNNFAVVQLRQDNAINSLYNIVGFQTNLKWPEQKRVFSLIPGLEKAEFVRYGVMHKNNYINSPNLINKNLQLHNNKNIFFAGQIIGVEGYIESASTGIIAGMNMVNFLQNKPLLDIEDNFVLGSLINYVVNSSKKDFKPMKSNWDIVNIKIEGNFKKLERKRMYSDAAIKNFDNFLKKIKR